MSSHSEAIKNDLISLYTSFYYMSQNEAAANLFNKDVLKKLKYKPEEIAEVLESCNARTERQKQKVRAEIIEIKTKEQVLEYFQEYLLPVCQPELSEEEKNILLKKITLDEIRHLYKIIFGIPLKDKCKKSEAIYKIKDFFDNEERTADLTKNL